MTMEFVNGRNLEEFLERHVETNQYASLTAVFIVSRICRSRLCPSQDRRQRKALGIVHRTN